MSVPFGNVNPLPSAVDAWRLAHLCQRPLSEMAGNLVISVAASFWYPGSFSLNRSYLLGLAPRVGKSKMHISRH